MLIRKFHDDDARAIGNVAVAAFSQFENDYDNWPSMINVLRNMSELSDNGEIMVAEHHGEVVGAVAYMPPNVKKADYFMESWPVIRMLVVDPLARGIGIGRRLTEACVSNAVRDECKVIALHTSPIMVVALAMYRRMGFKEQYGAPTIYGVPYNVYLKAL